MGIAGSCPESIFPEADFLKTRRKRQSESLGEVSSEYRTGGPLRADTVVDNGIIA